MMRMAPKLVVFMSASVDGRTALAPGRTQWEEMDDSRTSAIPNSARVWQELKAHLEDLHEPGARLLGSGSLVSEGDPLPDLPPLATEHSQLQEDSLPPDLTETGEITTWLTVVDSRGRLRSGYTGSENPGQHMLHLVSRSTPLEYLSFLRDKGIPYIVAGTGRVDLRRAMGLLEEKLGVRTILCEGGGTLNGVLLREGLVNELNVLVRPELIGGTRTPTLFDCPDLTLDQWPTPLVLLSAEPLQSGFLWLRYAVASGVLNKG